MRWEARSSPEPLLGVRRGEARGWWGQAGPDPLAFVLPAGQGCCLG